MVSKASMKAQAFFFGLLLSAPAFAGPYPITITGWPFDPDKISEIVLNRDPLMGNLVCPALTRLNLEALKSESVLLDPISVQGNQWVLKLRSNLRWWNGAEVNSKDLSEFLDLNFKTKLSGLGPWEIPAYTLKAETGQVRVEWAKKPEFGPYVLNFWPLTQKIKGADGLNFQCAGAYKPTMEKAGTWIFLSSKQTTEAPSFVLKAYGNGASGSDGDRSVAFRFGDELHPPGLERQIEEELICLQPIDMPMLSFIAWNPDGPLTRDSIFRKAVTQLLPRGAILRAGAGSLGNLVSAPILRAHPGYRKNIFVLPYDPKKSNQILDQMELQRSEKDGYRRTKDGKLLQMTVLVDKEGSGLLQKVLDDSFRSLGIRVNFVKDETRPVDGVLAGIVLPWPESDISPLFHSKRAKKLLPWSYKFPEIDQALDLYATSLTQVKPDFTLLEKVHDLVYKQEPYSILIQHRACVQPGKNLRIAKKPAIRNPDWFKDMLAL